MNGLFTYKSSGHYGHEFRSVIDWPTAFRIAEIFRSTKVPGKYFSVIGYLEHNDQLPEPQHSEVMSLVEGLDRRWKSDVYQVANEIAIEERDEKRLRSYEAVQHAGIREFLLQNLHSRGAQDAALHDMTGIFRGAPTAKDRNGNLKYRPVASGAKPLFKEAIAFAYSQEAYADHSLYAVPVQTTEGWDPKVFRSNLGMLCEAIRTHNGFAGSGSTWSASLYEGEHPFVVFNCRASISD